MAETQNNSGDLIQRLTRDLISNVTSFFERLRASDHRALGEFSAEETPGIVVVYTSSGMPVAVSALTDSQGRREIDRLEREIRGIDSQVRGATFRTVPLGDSDLARHLARIISELFSSSLPLGLFGLGGEATSESTQQSASESAPKRRGRKPGSGKAAAVAGRRGPGRPPRIQVGLDAAAGTSIEQAAPRRRGRRPKSESAGGAVAAGPRRRGRRPRSEMPEGMAAMMSGEAPAAKRRGRKPGSKNRPKPDQGGADQGVVKRRPGRPKKQ